VLARGRHAAAEDHPVRRHDDDHVGDPDREVTADLGQAVDRPRVPALGCADRLLRGRRPASGGDLVGPGVGLEAAAVAAPAPRAIGIDRLVAHLAGGPVVALVHPPVDGDDAADAGAQRQSHDRGGSPPRSQPQLGQPECPGVVDQRDRQAERGRDGPGDRSPVPIARHVDEEARRAGRRVVQPRDADADRADARPAGHGTPGGVDEGLDDGVRAGVGGGPDVAAVERRPRVGAELRHDPLGVRGTEIQPQVTRRAPPALRPGGRRAIRLPGHGHDSPVTRV
jgi:hypothetical protein